MIKNKIIYKNKTYTFHISVLNLSVWEIVIYREYNFFGYKVLKFVTKAYSQSNLNDLPKEVSNIIRSEQ